MYAENINKREGSQLKIKEIIFVGASFPGRDYYCLRVLERKQILLWWNLGRLRGRSVLLGLKQFHHAQKHCSGSHKR